MWCFPGCFSIFLLGHNTPETTMEFNAPLKAVLITLIQLSLTLRVRFVWIQGELFPEIEFTMFHYHVFLMQTTERDNIGSPTHSEVEERGIQLVVICKLDAT